MKWYGGALERSCMWRFTPLHRREPGVHLTSHHVPQRFIKMQLLLFYSRSEFDNISSVLNNMHLCNCIRAPLHPYRCAPLHTMSFLMHDARCTPGSLRCKGERSGLAKLPNGRGCIVHCASSELLAKLPNGGRNCMWRCEGGH